MKISYNWLKDYIKTDLPANEIAKILTNTGLEVEGMEPDVLAARTFERR